MIESCGIVHLYQSRVNFNPMYVGVCVKPYHTNQGETTERIGECSFADLGIIQTNGNTCVYRQ